MCLYALTLACEGATPQAVEPFDAGADTPATPRDTAALDARDTPAIDTPSAPLDATAPSDRPAPLDAPRDTPAVRDVAADRGPSPRPPRGHLDVADCRGIWGWALDDDNRSVAVAVRATVGAETLNGLAQSPRPDVCAPAPGPCNVGFDLALTPSLRDGQTRPVVVYARDPDDGRETVIAMGSHRCVESPDAGAPVDTPTPSDQPVVGDDRIQVEMTQECTDGDGVTFRVRPTHPARGPEGYTFTWRVTEGSTRLTLNTLRDRAHVVLVGDGVPNHTHLELTITRPGYRTLTVPAALLWSSACAHDFNPTACPENLRGLSTNRDYYQRGDTFIVTAVDAPAGALNWYVNRGLDNVQTLSEGRTMTATVTQNSAETLVVTQSQPYSDPLSRDNARCHGWTQRYFVLR